ncbi:hypothetical protein GCM10010317_082450 [Streptomyces mirabilis]|uniref:transposase n=1 Tax=Streptomyces mirabilis TaxID=68239 RepID=UPI0019CD5C67|nr:hypothetical protein GCM10010317_082450 [Streptomyces mirabilis]
MPYTPAHHFPGGKNAPAFYTKLQIGAALARAAKTAGVVFRAVVADCAYGDHNAFRAELSDARLPFVMALKRGHGTWQYKDAFLTRRCRPRTGLARPRTERRLAAGDPQLP